MPACNSFAIKLDIFSEACFLHYVHPYESTGSNMYPFVYTRHLHELVSFHCTYAHHSGKLASGSSMCISRLSRRTRDAICVGMIGSINLHSGVARHHRDGSGMVTRRNTQINC